MKWICSRLYSKIMICGAGLSSCIHFCKGNLYIMITGVGLQNAYIGYFHIKQPLITYGRE